MNQEVNDSYDVILKIGKICMPPSKDYQNLCTPYISLVLESHLYVFYGFI